MSTEAHVKQLRERIEWLEGRAVFWKTKTGEPALKIYVRLSDYSMEKLPKMVTEAAALALRSHITNLEAEAIFTRKALAHMAG